MSASDDYILILHASDGGQWAKFISGRLATPQYGIRSISKDVLPAEPSEEEASSEIYTNQSHHSSSSSLKDTDNNKSDNNNNSDAGTSGSKRDSGRSSNGAVTESSSIKDCIDNCRASVVLLSPDILESDHPFKVDVTSLNPRRSVFMFLGVDIEEARSYFGNESDHVFKCRCCVIDGSERSICDAMCQIIEAYEDQGGSSVGDEEEDIYNIPPSPKQLNKIEKVFPQELTEKDRDVYILLERPAEDDVIAVVDSAMSQEIQLTCVCGRLYMLTLPDDAKGEIFFKVECQGICFGEESVQVASKLDRLKSILEEEVNPLSVLAKAMGLSPDDVDGVDTKLAFKLEQLSSAPTFRKLFPCEDALITSGSDERSEFLYPSLLHFAADLNLRTFCSVLLRYPGMLAAACTENRDGEYPSQIAQRKGFTKLEADLIQFVEDQKRIVENENDNLYVEPSPPRPVPAPKPHVSKGPGYVNQADKKSATLGSDCNYIDMSSLHAKPPLLERLRRAHRASSESSLFRKKLSGKKKNLQSQHSDTELVSPVSKSSDNVFSTSLSFSSKGEDDEEDEPCNYQNIDELDMSPKFSLWNKGTSLGTSSKSLPSEYPPDEPLSSPSTPSRKALKMLGVSQDEIVRSRANTLEPPHRAGNRSDSPSDRDRTLTTIIPHGVRYPGITQMSAGHGRISVTGCDETKQRAMKDKIKSFFGKMKNKRSNSDGELILAGAHPVIKKSPSNRSERTNSGRSHRDKGAEQRKKSSLAEATPEKERDSGSYSDEEKDKSSPLPNKKNPKPKVFKERERPMSRRLSRRAQAALNDSVGDAPTLPSTEKRKGAFRSFIEDV